MTDVSTGRKALWIVAIAAWVALAAGAWILRDGLGPDAVDSRGAGAAERWFWTFYCGPIGVALAVVGLIAAVRACRTARS